MDLGTSMLENCSDGLILLWKWQVETPAGNCNDYFSFFWFAAINLLESSCCVSKAMIATVWRVRCSVILFSLKLLKITAIFYVNLRSMARLYLEARAVQFSCNLLHYSPKRIITVCNCIFPILIIFCCSHSESWRSMYRWVTRWIFPFIKHIVAGMQL